MTVDQLFALAEGLVALKDRLARAEAENAELRAQLGNYVQAHANVCEDLAREEGRYAELARAWQEASDQRDDLRNRLRLLQEGAEDVLMGERR